MKLTDKDYKIILKYYNINTENLSKIEIQEKAESILAEKMCRCIKKLDSYNSRKKNKLSESNIISICKKSVLSNKNIKNYSFTCKKKQKFIPKKGTNIVLIKTKKNLKLYRSSRKKD
jgi:hypothetical protein